MPQVVKMKLTFLQTGGTIDKGYPRKTKGYCFEITEPAVKRILRRVNPNFEFDIISILKKDSRDITEEDREVIYKTCKHVENDKIIVTHGTDTMLETAKKIRTIESKTIVLTGAMKPERFSTSDADFNVGTAIGAVNVLSKGVYIAMHGRVYPSNAVKRDKETGQFVEK